MKTEKEKYFNNIKGLFPIHGKKEKEYLSQISIGINEYLNEVPTANYNELQKEFGDPKEIVMDYYKETDSAYLLSKMNTRKIVYRVSVCLLLITFISATYFAISWHNALETMREETIVSEETIIAE